MRWVLLRALARPALRSARMLPLAIGTALGSAVAVAPALAGVELEVHDVVMLLRCSMVIMAIGAAFVLDDPTGRTTEAVPVPRAWVSLLRCLAAVTVLGAAWAVQLTVAPLAVSAEARAALPTASLTLEPLALTVWALVLGSLGARFTAEGSGGTLAGPGMILMMIAALLLPEEAALFAQPQSEGWERSHWIWTALLAAGTLGLGVATGRRLSPLGQEAGCGDRWSEAPAVRPCTAGSAPFEFDSPSSARRPGGAAYQSGVDRGTHPERRLCHHQAV